MKKNICRLLLIATLLITSLKLISINILEDKIVDNVITKNKTYVNTKALYIPKIKLKKIIVLAEKDYGNLNSNLVYYKSIKYNDRIIIFGHANAGYGKYFNRIDELKVGDNAYLYYDNYKINYIVSSVEIIRKTDVDILYNRENKKELLLVTCYKKDTDKRLMVKLMLKSVISIEK